MKSTDPRTDMQNGFHAGAVRRPIALLVMLATLILIGGIAYSRIPLQMLPGGFEATRYSVWVSHPDSSAQENEEKVARVLEEQFRTLPNLVSDKLYSNSSDDGVRLRVAFNGNADLQLAKAELRDRIERARPLLPDSVQRIHVWANDDGDPPIMFFALTAKEQNKDTDYLIDERIQAPLEAIDGVSQVQIWGTLADSIRILLNEEQVRAHQLNIGDLIQRMARDNFTLPLGEITDGRRRFLLRSDMRFESLEQIAAYPIGGGLRLSDVASVERVKTIRERVTRIDGAHAYWGIIQKESTGNVVEITERIDKVLAGFKDDPKLAGNFDATVFFSQAKFIQNSLGRLRSTALWGGGLAALVLLLFLRRVRMTLCVALAIPVSALLSIAFEYFTGGSFNVLTMAGLTLGIGMLVDNSVVVIENITRLRVAGRSGREAAVEGVREVGLAIALATLTSVVVFLPLIFMGSNPVLRIMLGALGIPLCTSLLFSLLVALVFLPVSTSRILGSRPAAAVRVGGWIAPLLNAPVRALALAIGALRFAGHAITRAVFFVNRITLAVLTPLRWVLAIGLLGLAAWRVQTLSPILGTAKQGLDPFGIPTQGVQAAQGSLWTGVVFVMLAAGLAIFGLPRWRGRPSRSPAAPENFAPEGTSIIQWLQAGNRSLLGWTLNHRVFASVLAVLAFASVGIPISNMPIAAFGQEEDTTSLDVRVSLEDNFTFAEASQEMAYYEQFLEGYREEFGFEHMISRFNPGGGEVGMRWAEQQDPDYLNEIRFKLRQTLPKYPGHRVRLSSEQQLGSTSKQFVWFQLRGTNAEALESYGQQAIELLEAVPGLTDVSTALEAAPEQVRLEIDPEAAHSYGVTADTALRNVAWVLRGANLPRFHEEGREVPLIMEYDTERLAGLDTLRDLQVFNGEGIVPLSAFTDLSFARGARSIRRTNGKTTFNIQARLTDPNRQLEIVDAGYAALDALDMPRGFSLGRDDSARSRQRQETGEMLSAVTLSIVLVFLLMAILFESLLLPISVLTTIPFAVLGAMWCMFITGTVMDSVGWIGIIILVGLVVNNGIVLIDKIHRLRLSGIDRELAVCDGASARVRPILMTALTTIFGLMPMALGEPVRQGIDYRALATCVAGGLTISTFFTLWVVPLAYTLADDLAHSLGWVGRRSLQWGLSKRNARFAAAFRARKSPATSLAGAGAAHGPMDKA